jgi:hypothetical protein
VSALPDGQSQGDVHYCVHWHCKVAVHNETATVACKATAVQAGLSALVADNMCHISSFWQQFGGAHTENCLADIAFRVWLTAVRL